MNESEGSTEATVVQQFKKEVAFDGSAYYQEI